MHAIRLKTIVRLESRWSASADARTVEAASCRAGHQR
jgi:hypothetical protein